MRLILKEGEGMSKLNLLLVFVFLSLCFASSVNAEEGLVAYYSFDEGSGEVARDGSGNGNDGKIHGATWVKGKSGSALKFDGADDYVDCGNDSSLQNLSALTYEAWIYPTAVASWQAIISKRQKRLSLGSTGRNLFWDVTFATEYDRAFSSAANIPLNQWSHVAATWSPGKAKIYLNGELVDDGYTYGSGNPNSDGNTNQEIARNPFDSIGEHWFNGTIDEVRIYNRALPKEEIQRHYRLRGKEVSAIKPATSAKPSISVKAGISVKPTTREVSQIPRVAFVYSRFRDWHKHAYDEIFASLEYNSDRWENINVDKLVESLDKYDILLFHENCQLKNPQNFSKYKKKWFSFLKRGGVIIVQDVQEMPLDWITSLGPSFNLSLKAFPDFQESVEWTNPLAELNFGSIKATWAHFKDWSPEWIVTNKNAHNMPIVLYQRLGKGLIVVTTSYFSSGFPREKHLKTIWSLILKEHERPPIKVSFLSWGRKFLGENKFKIKVENKGGAPFKLIPVVTLSRNGERVFTSKDKVYQIPVNGSKGISLPYHIAKEGFHSIRVVLYDNLKEKVYFRITGEVEIEDLEELISRLKGKIEEVRETFLFALRYFPEDADIYYHGFTQELKRLSSFDAQSNRWEKKIRKIASTGKTARKVQFNNIKEAIHNVETLGKDVKGCNISKLAKICMNLGITSDKQTQFVISQATSLEKVFRDRVWNRAITHEIKLQMAINEYESAQLVMVPLVKELHNVKVTCTDLISRKAKKRISADNIDIWPVGYVSVGKGANWWPDPLLRKESFDVSLKDGVVQPIWITVYVPKGTASGNYTGDIVIEPSNAHKAKVRLIVKVWDFTLSKEQHLKTNYSVRPNQISGFYNSTQDYRKVLPVEEYRKYLEILLRYRITPALYDESNLPPSGCEYYSFLAYLGESRNPDGSYSFDYSTVEENFKYCWDRGANSISVGNMKSYNSPTYKEFLPQYIKDVTCFLKERGWLNRVYLYGVDEPQPGAFQITRELNSLVKKISPDLKILIPASGSSKALVDESIIDGIDIWSPCLGFLDLEECAKQKRAGKEVWFYANHMFNIPRLAMSHRIVFWMCWKYNLDGFLYWGTCWWEPHNLNDVDEAGPKESWDPHSISGTWWKGAAGDGFLLYPSLAGKPVHSIRLEVTRDGLEDWEYLYLLREKTEELKKKKIKGYKVLVKEAERLLEIDDAIVEEQDIYTENPQKIYERRKKIARHIEKIIKVLKGGA